jgi:hypothetical protein
MKSAFILCALASFASATEPVLNRVTAETVRHLQQMSPMLRMEKPAEGKGEAVRPVEQSIIKESTILSDGTHWTLVPVGAVVFLPEAMKTHVNARPAGKLLPWLEFLAKNISWITTTELNPKQAAGSESLPAERTAFWAKQDKVVIAVHQNGPISMRAPSKP